VIVVDASALLEVLLNRAAAARLRWRLFAPKETLHAPHLLDVEVLQVLRRYSLRSELSDQDADAVIRIYGSLPIARYTHEPLLERAWQMRANVTAYDAIYIALAEALGAVFVTSDVRLAKSVANHVRVEVFA
jgi:predicted nucleic acid-binding protein